MVVTIYVCMYLLNCCQCYWVVDGTILNVTYKVSNADREFKVIEIICKILKYTQTRLS